MSDSTLTITPLGGLGEIGINCQMWETNKGLVLIDCGLMFPDDSQLGVDVVIPPLEPILKRKDRLQGIIITHGHEDHIGALPWLVNHIEGVKIFSSPLTLSFIGHKLRERGLLDKVKLIPVAAKNKVTLCDLHFHFFSVSHSIPQGFSLAIESSVGRIIHTGDFKLDNTSSYAHAKDIKQFRDFAGKDGVRLLLSDSTNVEHEGYSKPESVVKDALRNIFTQAYGRIIITLFSSHIERIQSVFEIAREFDRSVVLSGRSLNATVERGHEFGYFKDAPPIYADYEVPDISPKKLLILATGSQGEPLSALARITTGGHRRLGIKDGDTVIMSSSAIPGNAPAINRLINLMYKQGAQVFYEGVHATGHAQKEELRAMLLAVKPQVFVPIHGEFRHLVRHKELACECGVDKDKAIILEDGQPLTLMPDSFRIEEKIAAESLLVDGKGVGDVGVALLRERQLLGEAGVVVVSLVLSAKTGEIISGPDIISRGFIFAPHCDNIHNEAKNIIIDKVEKRRAGDDAAKLGERIRSALRSFFREIVGRDPVVLPTIAEI